MTKITVMLLTYDRYEYAEKTLINFLNNVVCSDELHVHIADDGSPGDYVDKLKYAAGCYDKVKSVGATISNRRGYGGNYNLATHAIHGTSDFVFPLEDDWKLVRQLNLDGYIQDLTETKYNAVRFGYLGWTYQQLCELVGINFRTYIHLLPDSTNQYVFSGHPRIEKVSYQRNIGLWPEGLNPGQTEINVASRMEAREGILIHLENYAPFVHFGDVKSGDLE